MRILQFSDLHITTNWTDNLFKQVEQDILISQPDFIVSLGDEIHTPAKLGSQLEEHLYRYFSILNASNVPVYVILGTLSHNGSYMDSITFTKSFPNITFMNEITELEIMNKKCLFIPELYDVKSYKYAEIFDKSYDFCFGHGSVSGFFYTGSAEQEEYDTIERTNPSSPTFTLDNFKNIQYTFFGHYHNHTVKYFNHAKNYFTYIGSYTTRSFGEVTELKGAVLFDDTEKLISNRIKQLGNPEDFKFVEVEMTEYADLALISTYKKSGYKTRALITDNTNDALRLMVVKQAGNFKDISEADRTNKVLNEAELERYKYLETKYERDGFLETVKSYVDEKDLNMSKEELTKIGELYGNYKK